MAQLEREAAGFDESSEPTSMTNSSTVEGEHTIQDVQNEDEDERTLNIEAAQAELNDKIEEASEVAQEMIQAEPDVVETYSNNLRPNEDEIQLLRLKLEEVRIFFIRDFTKVLKLFFRFQAQCKNRVIQEEMGNLKAKVSLVENHSV